MDIVRIYLKASQKTLSEDSISSLTYLELLVLITKKFKEINAFKNAKEDSSPMRKIFVSAVINLTFTGMEFAHKILTFLQDITILQIMILSLIAQSAVFLVTKTTVWLVKTIMCSLFPR